MTSQHRAKAQQMVMVFKRLDRDGNGQLSMREFAAGMARAHQGGAFHGGGKPHAQQHQAVAKRGSPSKGAAARAAKVRAAKVRAAKARAAKMRAAKMGAAKMRAAKARAAKAHGGHGQAAAGRRAKPGRAPQAGDRKARARGAAILWRLRQADADGDGRLTRREAPGLLKKHFSKLDKNEDGVLTLPEVKRAVQMLQQKGAANSEKQAKPGKPGDAKAKAKARAKAKKRARKKQGKK